MSEIPPLPTPIQDLVTLYKKHNKSSLDVHHLVCGSCNTWLEKPVYLTGNSENACGPCAKLSEGESIRNLCLEKLLEGGTYPCKYNAFGCHVFDAGIQQHEAVCNYNIRCFCDEVVGNRQRLIEHLKTKHAMFSLQLIKPVADITVTKINLKEAAYHLFCREAGETRLVGLVQHSPTENQLNVSVYNASEIPRNISYIIKITVGGTDYSKKGCVTNTFLDPEGKTTLVIPNLENCGSFLCFKIYFENYQNFEPFEKNFESMMKEYECPICLETITNACYQCVNGHNVCPNCKTKITVCPICRMQVNEYRVNTKNLTSQIQRLCKNITNGCFVHDHIPEIEAHEKTCSLRLIKCEICNIGNLDKAAYLAHMSEKHELQVLHQTPANVKAGYIYYRGIILKLGYNDSVEAEQLKANWFVRLIYGFDQATAYDYQLTITVQDRSITINSKTQDNEKENCVYFSDIPEDTAAKLTLSLGDFLYHISSQKNVFS